MTSIENMPVTEDQTDSTEKFSEEERRVYLEIYEATKAEFRELMESKEFSDDDIEKYFGSKYGKVTEALLHKYIVSQMEKEELGFDFLTDLHNRRSFEEALQKRLKDLARSEERRKKYLMEKGDPLFSLIVFDVDGFKQINDSFGHLAGDEILRSIGAKLKQEMRDEDFIARIGGEEFAVIIGDNEESNPVKIAERIRQTIKGVYYFEDKEIPVSISVGVSLSSPQASPETIFQLADLALQAAKGNEKAVKNMLNKQQEVKIVSALPEAKDSRDQTWFFQEGVLQKYSL